jgi:Flp pilus assembly protein TadG
VVNLRWIAGKKQGLVFDCFKLGMVSVMALLTAQKRKGTAVVELAVCLPVLVIIAFGAIEATNAVFLKERLTAAAYEGARSATGPGHTTATATAVAQNVLTQFAISNSTITISPTITISTTTGTQVTVTVAAPFSSNSCMTPYILGKVLGNVSATVVMIHQ